MKVEELLDLEGHFVWCWNQYFIITTDELVLLWSSPDYNGDNTIRPWTGSTVDLHKYLCIDWGKCKGRHKLKDFCGDKIILQDPIPAV